MIERVRVSRGAVVHAAFAYGGVVKSMCGHTFALGDVLRGAPADGQRMCLMCARMLRTPFPPSPAGRPEQ